MDQGDTLLGISEVEVSLNPTLPLPSRSLYSSKQSCWLFHSPNSGFPCPGLLSSLVFGFWVSVKSTCTPISQECCNASRRGEVSFQVFHTAFDSLWCPLYTSFPWGHWPPLSATLDPQMCICLLDLSSKRAFTTAYGASPLHFSAIASNSTNPNDP